MPEILNGSTSPLKYPGGKRFLLGCINSAWQSSQSKRFVEPFLGGGSVSLGVNPGRAVVNDLNPHVINFYKSIKEGLLIDMDMINSKEFYYRSRDRFNEIIASNDFHTHEAASLFYYLNRTGFNGLVRFNQKGFYNVPFGAYKKINYIRDFSPVRKIVRKWLFKCDDFSKIRVYKDDFIYADPPYDVDFRNYAGNSFEWGEQLRLVKHLSKYQCPIVISNQATDRVVDLYRSNGYEVCLLDAPRMISCKGDRAKAREVMAFKNADIDKSDINFQKLNSKWLRSL